MSTDNEIAGIKERLDKIEDSLVDLKQLVMDSLDNASGFELLDFTFEKSESTAGTDQYTYEISVRNTTEHQLGFSGYVLFLDSDGCEVHRDGIDFFNVEGLATHTQSGCAEIFSNLEMMKIAKLEADVYSMPQDRHAM